MTSLRIWLLYKKLLLFGDEEFEKNGCKIIPCVRCNALFKSYMHYGESTYVIDNLCEKCRKKE